MKAKVPVKDLADLLTGSGGMRRVGDRWVARCPLPGHEDRTPSFTVYLETNSWYCYGCSRGGDVVDLATAAWCYGDGEMAMAAADVLTEFGHPIPARPESWYAKNSRQQPIRDAIEDGRIRYLRRRIFTVFFKPLVDSIDDLDEQRACADDLWELTLYPARKMYENGMMRR